MKLNLKKSEIRHICDLLSLDTSNVKRMNTTDETKNVVIAFNTDLIKKINKQMAISKFIKGSDK